MIQSVKLLAITCVTTMFIISGCAKKPEQKPVPRDPGLAVSCIGVMPVQPAVDVTSAMSFAQAKQLKEGATIMDSLLKKEFAGRREFRFVSPAQVYGLDVDGTGSELGRLQKVAEQMSCNAMLEINISRFLDRIGGEYTAKDPASVAFQYRLYEVGEGKILCQGSFDEVQQSLMENLYNWKNAKNRGFTWITSEQLLQEGIQEKFSQCGYLLEP